MPSGELYARLMGHMSLASYEALIKSLADVKLITDRGHLLVWTGPKA